MNISQTRAYISVAIWAECKSWKVMEEQWIEAKQLFHNFQTCFSFKQWKENCGNKYSKSLHHKIAINSNDKNVWCYSPFGESWKGSSSLDSDNVDPFPTMIQQWWIMCIPFFTLSFAITFLLSPIWRNIAIWILWQAIGVWGSLSVSLVAIPVTSWKKASPGVNHLLLLL